MPAITTIVGNLVKDPEAKDFGPNKNVTNIRVACSDSIPDGKGGWKDGDTAYYNVSAWRNLAKYMASTLKKVVLYRDWETMVEIGKNIGGESVLLGCI